MSKKSSARTTRVIRAFRKRIALAVRDAERAAARAETAAAKARELVKLFEILSAPAPQTPAAEVPVETAPPPVQPGPGVLPGLDPPEGVEATLSLYRVLAERKG